MNGRLLAAAAALFAMAGAASSASAGEVLDRVRQRREVHVCISPEYPGIGYRDPRSGEMTGFDVELAASLGSDLGVAVRQVPSSALTLDADLLRDRCDVAMYAVAITPERQQVLRFSRPYLRSDIHAVASVASRSVRRWEDIDRPGVIVGVRGGSFLEPLVARDFHHARIVVVRSPRSREHELASGRVDVFLASHAYGLGLLHHADWIRLIRPPAPFHRVFHAYPVRPGDEEWLRTVDGFVERAMRDGRMQRLARKYDMTELLVP